MIVVELSIITQSDGAYSAVLDKLVAFNSEQGCFEILFNHSKYTAHGVWILRKPSCYYNI